MASIPLSLSLILFVQTTAGELSLPSLPEAVQLLQLEKIRGLKQTILEKEDENQKLEEMIKSVTHNNTLMKDEMIRTISEKENVIREIETRLQDVEDEKAAEEQKNALEREKMEQTILDKDGTIRQLETRIQGLELDKAAIEKQNVMVKEENAQRMVAMESEKTQMREDFVKKQTERDAMCQDEKREIDDLKNKELDEMSERLHLHERSDASQQQDDGGAGESSESSSSCHPRIESRSKELFDITWSSS